MTSTLPDPATPNEGVYHAEDCGGACDGCGFITARLRWLPGPCPPWARPFQRVRSELGHRFMAGRR